ncbi:hypothetical protein PIB30_058257 [Stylosanthes scabra]|uniref:DUF4283 domain-containing protein n=1 Tax=Stylosanthes scabra TaxID=79078 RepID=A0ABU6ZIL2_9FABA|nr:hypothetical protein [Stylosanthes scabra]
MWLLGSSTVELTMNNELNEKMKRSLVREALNPIDYPNLKKSMTEAKMMGSRKIVMKFESIEKMVEAEKSESLLAHFMEVRRWTPKDVNRSRRIWLEVYGLPANAWTSQNMMRIGGVWGSVLRVDEGVGGHFNAFRVLVEANFAPAVQAFVTVKLDGQAYEVMVKDMRIMNNYPEERLEDGGRVRTILDEENVAVNEEAEGMPKESGGESKNESNSVTVGRN